MVMEVGRVCVGLDMSIRPQTKSCRGSRALADLWPAWASISSPNKDQSGTCSRFRIRRGIKAAFARLFCPCLYISTALSFISASPLHGEKAPKIDFAPIKILCGQLIEAFLSLVVGKPDNWQWCRASPVRMATAVLAILLSNQSPVNTPGKAPKDGPRTWDPVTHVGYQNRVPGS